MADEHVGAGRVDEAVAYKRGLLPCGSRERRGLARPTVGDRRTQRPEILPRRAVDRVDQVGRLREVADRASDLGVIVGDHGAARIRPGADDARRDRDPGGGHDHLRVRVGVGAVRAERQAGVDGRGDQRIARELLHVVEPRRAGAVDHVAVDRERLATAVEHRLVVIDRDRLSLGEEAAAPARSAPVDEEDRHAPTGADVGEHVWIRLSSVEQAVEVRVGEHRVGPLEARSTGGGGALALGRIRARGACAVGLVAGARPVRRVVAVGVAAERARPDRVLGLRPLRERHRPAGLRLELIPEPVAVRVGHLRVGPDLLLVCVVEAVPVRVLRVRERHRVSRLRGRLAPRHLTVADADAFHHQVPCSVLRLARPPPCRRSPGCKPGDELGSPVLYAGSGRPAPGRAARPGSCRWAPL